jgi:peptidoglycan/xylan/chitin deacetylase (PgdA/CDA1 family)
VRPPRTPHRPVRWLLALAVPAALVIGACAEPAQPAPGVRWVGGAGGGTGAPVGPDHGDDDAGGTPTPGATSASPRPGSPRPTPRDYLSRIPKFRPAPPPQPITVGSGPTAAWLLRIPTTQPVAFLTIDDGWIKRPEAVGLLQAAHVPVTLFLTINAISDNPGYFSRLQSRGAVIEAHTITHTSLAGLPYDVQKREICGSADRLGTLYRRRPVLFRPPFGVKDATTLQVVHDCGLKAAFFWKETVNNGVVRYQEGNRVRPGDIILMHFRATFVEDFLAALHAIADAGLTPALLESYIR